MKFRKFLMRRKRLIKGNIDPLALMSKKQGKYVSRSTRREKIKSSDDPGESGDSDPKVSELKYAVAMLSKTLKSKRYYKNFSSNRNQYSSTSKKPEYRGRDDERKYYDRKKYDSGKYEGKDKFDDRKKYQEKKDKDTYEKRFEEVHKCFRCGKLGHYAKEFK